MKKSLLGLAVATLFLASCAKDRTCSCTQSSSAGGTSDTYTVTLVEVTKGQAKANCVSTTQTENGVTYTSDCKLS